MDLEVFAKSFQNREIDIKPYIIILSIFLSILIVTIIFNNNLNNYYIINGRVVDKQIELIVNNDELNKIVENKKILIERNNHMFTYKVVKINNLNNSNYLLSEIFLESELPDEYLINNNIIKLKIVTKKITIFDYLIKSLKGEL